MASNKSERVHNSRLSQNSSPHGRTSRSNRSEPVKPTSFASRKRKRVHATMSDILNMSSLPDDEPVDHASSFRPDSLVHDTWGSTTQYPQTAIQSRRKNIGVRKRLSAFQRYMMGEVVNGVSALHNSPERCILLRFPLEIRQKIYKEIFHRPKCFAVKSDLVTLRATYKISWSIILACKQLAMECQAWLYGTKVFWVDPGNTCRQPRHSHLVTPIYQTIQPKFISMIRDVFIECDCTQWHQDLARKTASTIDSLRGAGANLSSITLSVTPICDHTPPYSNVSGAHDSRKSIDTWLIFRAFEQEHRGSAVMAAILKSHCSIFNLIIKLPKCKPVIISFNMVYLLSSDDKTQSWINDDAAIQGRKQRHINLLDRLCELHETFKLLLTNTEEVVKQGKARYLEEWEKATDGARLATRREDPNRRLESEKQRSAPFHIPDPDLRRMCAVTLRSSRDSVVGIPL